MAAFGVADRAGHLPPAPQHGAARQAGGVARSPARPGGGMIVIFGNSLKSAPVDAARPTRSRSSTASCRSTASCSRGSWSSSRRLLAALYRWTPFGLSTRAASENEVSAMLVGLSPSRLAVMNTVLACVVAGGLGVLVAPLIALDAQTLAFQVVPLSALRSWPGSPRSSSPASQASRSAMMQSLLDLLGHARAGSRPTPGARRSGACPSCSSSSSSSSPSSCAGRACPDAASWSRSGCPSCPGRSGC